MGEHLSSMEHRPNAYLQDLKSLTPAEVDLVKARLQALIEADIEDGDIAEPPTEPAEKWAYLENALGWEQPAINRAFGKARHYGGATNEEIIEAIKLIIPNFQELL